MSVLDPQELQLLMAVNSNVDAGNKTLTSARASIALNHLPSFSEHYANGSIFFLIWEILILTLWNPKCMSFKSFPDGDFWHPIAK